LQFEYEVNLLLEKMTLDEKIGQLNQRGPSMVGAFDVDPEELMNMVFDGRISKKEFQQMMNSASKDFHEEDLRAGKVGSYNGIGDIDTINRLQKIAVEETRLGIPLFFGYDVVHGYRSITPIPLAESCAWDTELWEETARMSAEEATADGIHMTFAPMVDVSKDARWGRISEGAGEDTLLNSSYGVAKVKGFQGASLHDENSLAACVKHFAAYGSAEAGKDYNSVDISPQRLYEQYLPPFKDCIEAGARAIMPAFNDINGIPCSASQWLLKDILRKEWKFAGVTVSDANAIPELANHRIAKNATESALLAINAGLNIDMISNCYAEELSKLVNDGHLDIKVIDEAVTNVLRMKFELGLFSKPYPSNQKKSKAVILSKEKRQVALKSAEKSIVLLKNEGILPISKQTKIGIVGRLASLRGEMTGTWAIRAEDDDCISIIDACASQNVDFKYSESLYGVEECDILLLALGEYKNESGEGASKADISLPREQVELLQEAKRLNKPVVVILFNGRPLAIPEVAEYADAILEAWHPGIEAGNAILNIIFGKVNPSGKLTTTFPYATGQCPIYYDHLPTGRPGGRSKFSSKYLDAPLYPVYPFGHGLSYTTFTYSNLKIQEFNEHVNISIDVKNSGECTGEEIVQLYVQNPVSTRVHPVKKLVSFSKLFLSVGEKKTATFVISKKQLCFYDVQMNLSFDSGEYTFYAGASSIDNISGFISLTNIT
jgi:beta-glucosidase